MNESLIKVENLSKKFCRDLKKSLWYGLKDLSNEIIGQKHNRDGQLRSDEFWALKDINFELKRGECLGLIGRNGAGKTTLLRVLNGLIKPDKGRIERTGRLGALIALGAGFNPVLTGRENIYINASVLGVTKKEVDEKFDEIVNFAEIGSFIDSPVQTYSSGMQVRLGFAIAAVVVQPDILLLDEVLAVGDVGFQSKCLNTLVKFRENGASFILVSHNMHQISRYCNKVLFFKNGRTAYYGDCEPGVEKYLSDMQHREPCSEKDSTEWSCVSGSGKMVLTGARFRNAEEGEVTTIDVGESVTFEIDYKQHMEIQEPPVLDLLIRDRGEILFQGTKAISSLSFWRVGREGKIRIKFDSLPTNTDHLDFSLAILDSKTDEVFDWKRHIRLFIRRLSNHHGKLVLPVEWNIV